MNFYPSNIENDLELRAPLPKEHGPDVPTKYKYLLHNKLCRMYVACDCLELDTEARYTSLVLFHRYNCHYLNRDTDMEYKELDDHLGNVASTCLFLGCKTTEQPRRLRDIINISYKLDFRNENQNTNILNKERIDIYERSHPPDLNDSYWDMKETIILLEQSVLRLLHFDFIVSFPHRVLWLIIKTMNELSNTKGKDTKFQIKENEQEYQQQCIIKQAWSILNDTLFHTDALRYDVIVLASAALYISIKQINSNFENSNNQLEEKGPKMENWWKLFGVSDSSLFKAIACLERQ